MIRGLNHITLATQDLSESTHFYTHVLGAQLKARWPKGAYLELADLWLALILDPHFKAATDYSHLAFDVSAEDFEALAKKITDSGTQIWQENRSEGLSLYFCDPSGHRLELHVGDLHSRLASAKLSPWEGLEILN